MAPPPILRRVLPLAAAITAGCARDDVAGPSRCENLPASTQGFAATRVATSYPAAAPGPVDGWFVTQQAADVLLSGVDFDRTGGPLALNHPRSLASDGQRLVVSDGHNNRVLVWTALPAANTPPDLVLGQTDFTTNAPGTGPHQMSWPGQVAIGTDSRLVVADTYNDRVLAWLAFPTSSGQPADLVLRTPELRWPWGAWTDGTRLVVSATGARSVLVWQTFPARGDQPPDFILSGSGIGTPRTITSDGTALIVGDHNAFGDQVGNFFWRTFPTSATSALDFFAPDPTDARQGWMQGAFAPDGRLWLLGAYLNVWASVPASPAQQPDFMVTGYRFRTGDGAAVTFAGGRLYTVEYNGSRVLGFSRVPSLATDRPDILIGSASLDENVLLERFVLTNPVPASDGRSLAVSSDFDRVLVLWRELPDASGARPDWRWNLPFAPWDNEAADGMLVLGGQDVVAVWLRWPLEGEPPDAVYRQGIGPVRFQDVRGVALDARHLYVADQAAGKVYAWDGLPCVDAAPVATLEVAEPTRLSSDGTWLAVTQTARHRVLLWRTDALDRPPAVVGGVGTFNLPQGATVSAGRLLISDTGRNLVLLWHRAEDAAAGRPADVVLGAGVAAPQPPQAGRATFFWPGATALAGGYLWIGEFKFSSRLLRFRATTGCTGC